MSGLVEYASSILAQAERRVEIAAENLVNGTTPSYKRRVAFSTLIQTHSNDDVPVPDVAAAIDFRQGKFVETGKPTDVAIMGAGYFAFRRDDSVIYARQGQLAVDPDRYLVNAQGFRLQSASGSDIAVKTGDFQIRADGSVIDGGDIVGRIAVFASASAANGARDGGTLAPVDDATLRQGGFEASNVSTGDEMVLMMEALRRAESGQRVMNVYDDLMARVITNFGEAVR